MPLKSMKQAMDEFAAGELHGGKGGPVVKSQKQAIAIGLSVERRKGKRKHKKGAMAGMLRKRFR
jgi:hypothetical protein